MRIGARQSPYSRHVPCMTRASSWSITSCSGRTGRRATIFHTYSTYAGGLDMLVGACNFLDLAPKGRDEDGLSFTMGWVRHHDRYGD